MVPLSAPTSASQEGSASFGDKEPRNDKEKDKGEKSNRDKSVPQGQATGRSYYPLLLIIPILPNSDYFSHCLLLSNLLLPRNVQTGGAHVAANKKAGISAGVWAKETLPPLKSAPLQSDV